MEITLEFRSTCGLEIISVLFFFSLRQHRTRSHHLFENLPWTDRAAKAPEASEPANPPLLIASSRTVGFGDHDYPFHGHQKSSC